MIRLNMGATPRTVALKRCDGCHIGARSDDSDDLGSVAARLRKSRIKPIQRFCKLLIG